jgi:hypothetical protein
MSPINVGDLLITKDMEVLRILYGEVSTDEELNYLETELIVNVYENKTETDTDIDGIIPLHYEDFNDILMVWKLKDLAAEEPVSASPHIDDVGVASNMRLDAPIEPYSSFAEAGGASDSNRANWSYEDVEVPQDDEEDDRYDDYDEDDETEPITEATPTTLRHSYSYARMTYDTETGEVGVAVAPENSDHFPIDTKQGQMWVFVPNGSRWSCVFMDGDTPYKVLQWVSPTYIYIDDGNGRRVAINPGNLVEDVVHYNTNGDITGAEV